MRRQGAEPRRLGRRAVPNSALQLMRRVAIRWAHRRVRDLLSQRVFSGRLLGAINRRACRADFWRLYVKYAATLSAVALRRDATAEAV
ncbi:MAG: hypothetical protein ABWK05_03045 [Pyrobaculum sp.]